MKNLKNNPSVEINVVDPFSRKGFRFKGTTKIISSGEQYDKIISHYKKLGIKSSISSIVIVYVKQVNEVISPLYDLGYTEKEIETKWKKHYLSF
jgi:predicted pyridoxine 5'-phosphate oxidase superfamily flavin-nucleotide-binding protein